MHFFSDASAQINLEQFDYGTNYNTESGLSNNHTSVLIQDNYGFIWIGGANGVSRFDGTYFQNFKTVNIDVNNKKRIDFVTALYYDDINELLWIASFSGLYYTPTDTIDLKEYVLVESDRTGDRRVNAISVDDNNTLWVVGRLGMHNINLNALNENNVAYSGDDALFNRAISIKFDPFDDDILWIGTTRGLIKFDTGNNDYNHIVFNGNEEYAGNQVRKLYVAKDHVYLGTWKEGLLKYNKWTFKLEKLFNEELLNTGHKIIKSLVHNSKELLVTTSSGLLKLDLQNDRISDILLHNYDKNILKGLSFIDSNGNGWYAHKNGLFKYPKNSFQEEFFFIEERSEFENPFVPEKFVLNNNYCYLVGYKSRGIYKINLSNFNTEIIRLPNEFYSQEGLVDVTDMIQMDESNFLLLTESDILHFNSITYEINISDLKVNIEQPSFQAIVKDLNNTYWIGSRREGLFEINFNNNTIKQYKEQFNSDKKGSFPWINYMFLDSHNKLWLARGSFTVMDLNNKSIYNLDKEKTTSYFQDVSGFQEDGEGRIWVAGMSKGLAYTSFLKFSEGLVHKFDGNFNSLYKLNDSLIWTIGDKLGKLNTRNLTFKEIKLNGTYNKQDIIGPIVEIAANTFLVGCRNGFLKLKDNNYIENSEIAKPYIRELAYGDTVINNLGLKGYKIDLPKGTSSLTMKIGELSFDSNNNRFNYEYKLDKDWIDVADNNEVSIVNLNTGAFNIDLRPKSSDSNQQLSSNYRLSIVVPTPWWKTKLAYLIYLLSFTFLIFIVYRFLLSRKLALAESSRLKEINDIRKSLYTNITHEFRTPITVILGAIEFLKNKADSSKQEEDKSLLMIERNSQDLLRMVNTMLDLDRLENTHSQLDLSKGNIISFIKYIFESFESLARQNKINYSFYSEIEELIVDFDEDKLTTIFSNLLTNAFKFTPERGRIILHINSVSKNERKFLRIKLVDSGIGIPEEDLNKIFDRFYQIESLSSKQYKGTGLGLSLTKELVALMKGTIEVTSKVGQGSEFVVELAISNQPGVKVSDSKYLSQSQTVVSKESQENVYEPFFEYDKELPYALIIEDNRDVADYLKMCLSDAFNIIYAKDGEEGIKFAIKYVPDIIISDVMMPKVNGFELCTTLKKELTTDHIPIVLLTAKAAKEDRITGLTHGADAYLSKPFDKSELFVRIDHLTQLRKRMIKKFSSKDFKEFTIDKDQNPETIFIKKIIALIESNLDNADFGPVALAKKMHMSESQIYRKLKAITGRSTAVFMRSIRLNIAKKLLQNESKTVAEIAYEVGFKDPSWFGKAFKKEFGKSPSQL